MVGSFHVELSTRFYVGFCRVFLFGRLLELWVLENYMALCWVLPWLYGCIDKLPDDDKYEPPTQPNNKWSGAECKEWLCSRHLPTKGNVKELKERVKKHWGTLEAKNVGGKLETVKQVLLAEWCSISYLWE